MVDTQPQNYENQIRKKAIGARNELQIDQVSESANKMPGNKGFSGSLQICFLCLDTGANGAKVCIDKISARMINISATGFLIGTSLKKLCEKFSRLRNIILLLMTDGCVLDI